MGTTTLKKNIIFVMFNAPPHSGKDAACDHLLAKWPREFVKMSLADPLYAGVSALVGEDEDYFRDHKDRGVPSGAKAAITRRSLMIQVAENVVRPQLGRNWFARVLYERAVKKLVEQRYEDFRQKIVLVPDLGFPEEVDTIKNLGGWTIVVNVERPGKTFAALNDSRGRVLGDVVIFNNETLVEYHDRVAKVLSPDEIERMAAKLWAPGIGSKFLERQEKDE